MQQGYQSMKRLPRIAVFLGACAVILGGVWANGARADTVTVFAASSLHDALSAIAQAYEDETGAQMTLVFAASSAVARQVAQGAPADVVLLADVAWAQWLVEDGAVASLAPIAGNRLVLLGRDVAPIATPDALVAALGDGVLAMAQVDAVPAGRYGKAALQALGLWTQLEPRVVQAANVRAALLFVQRGEAPLAVGYASDLVAFPDLSKVYAFAADTHAPIVYSGGALSQQGVDFMTHILGKTGQAILADWGFLPVGAR